MHRTDGVPINVREEIRRETKFLPNGKAVEIVRRFKVINANDLFELCAQEDERYFANRRNAL